jgi:hypothetical protein
MADKTGRNNFDNQINNYLGFLQNEYATAAISLFLILYAGVIAPKLPPNVLRWFDNWIVQIALFFVIVYISNKNATIALIAAIAVLVTLMVANNQIVLKTHNDSVTAEKFCSSCNGCDNDDDENGEPSTYGRSEPPYPGGNVLPSRRLQSEVAGVMDEHIVEHDESVAGMEHAVIGGATTSRGGPKMPSKMEPDYPSHRHYAETEGESRNGRISGIKQSEMESEEVGSFLDESRSAESENASPEHNGMAPEHEVELRVEHRAEHDVEHEVEHESRGSSITSAEEIVHASVEQVTSEVEHRTGVEVSPETQKSVLSEVKYRVANLVRRGRVLTDFDVISVCREVYRRKH